MWPMNPGYALILGPLFGYALAKYIPDETSWYPKQFLLASTLGVLCAAIFSTFSWPATLILTGASIYAIAARNGWLLAACCAVFALDSSLILTQLLAIALIPAAGYFVHYKEAAQLWWFALVPIVIFGQLLL